MWVMMHRNLPSLLYNALFCNSEAITTCCCIKMAEKLKNLSEQVVESALQGYYDIMVIGKTGMGKSTTVEKMLIANLGDSRPANQQEEPAYNCSSRMLEHNDLIMWLVSDKPSTEKDYDDNALTKVSLRLMNLYRFSFMGNPHCEIDKSRESGMNIFKATLECEMFSNELTKVRVLDVPGFFGQEVCGYMASTEARARAVADAGLSTMRKVLRIKNTHNLRFRRVVYFLPERGVLKRTDQHLMMELQIMKEHFGRAIFDSMVVIDTESPGVYKFANSSSVMFSESDFEHTRLHLQEALQEIFNGEDVPEPPIEFLSLFDTCEEVLCKIQGAQVLRDSLMLEFKRSFCARCGLTIIEEGSCGNEDVYCTSSEQGPIHHDETTCHPIMVPKYSEIQRVVGGILHLITKQKFVGKWPSFESMDEVCVKCRQPPQTPGCMKIGTRFPGANEDGTVQHSSSAVETYQIALDTSLATNPPSAAISVPAGTSTPNPTSSMASTPTSVSTASSAASPPPMPAEQDGGANMYVGLGRNFSGESLQRESCYQDGIYRQSRASYPEDVKG